MQILNFFSLRQPRLHFLCVFDPGWIAFTISAVIRTFYPPFRHFSSINVNTWIRRVETFRVRLCRFINRNNGSILRWSFNVNFRTFPDLICRGQILINVKTCISHLICRDSHLSFLPKCDFMVHLNYKFPIFRQYFWLSIFLSQAHWPILI